MPKALYRYTCRYNLATILKCRHLALTESNFSLKQQGLFTVVWLTDSLTPDNMGLLFDANVPDDHNKTHIRFTVRKKPSMKRWDEWSNAKGMDKELKQALINSAFAKESYKSWYISEEIVPINDVLIIENTATGEVTYCRDAKL